ncbi:plasma membrane calcium-transporting ATPase 1-like [Rhincodon typus]|uniref:plasma membrane calcium-transporting ATPase 1-like n=1 Tax=Rhincodon typus TaxID=259920 RepID=UPI00202F09FD|nr:plasma membrane calcium-transporting ATPase 1-like [Rhincodon typus]
MGDMNNTVKYLPRKAIDDHDEGQFGCTLKELRDLMELRSIEAVHKIEECYGDVEGLCTRLKTSPVEGQLDDSKLKSKFR